MLKPEIFFWVGFLQLKKEHFGVPLRGIAHLDLYKHKKPKSTDCTLKQLDMKIKKLISVYLSIYNCTGKNVLVNVVIQNDARPYRDSTTFVSMSFTDVCRLIAYVIFSLYGDTSVIISKQNQDPSLKRARLMSVILQW